ncbi:hypothetical protein J3Q64DRAFT_1745873 [Phycomyces blakesleeanus]|uniref:Secreted protein n=1 Tax=Phycomyces blakesleeanus TaxID=4837 RepID=A0ABR3AXN5_PHYBL
MCISIFAHFLAYRSSFFFFFFFLNILPYLPLLGNVDLCFVAGNFRKPDLTPVGFSKKRKNKREQNRIAVSPESI